MVLHFGEPDFGDDDADVWKRRAGGDDWPIFPSSETLVDDEEYFAELSEKTENLQRAWFFVRSMTEGEVC